MWWGTNRSWVKMYFRCIENNKTTSLWRRKSQGKKPGGQNSCPVLSFASQSGSLDLVQTGLSSPSPVISCNLLMLLRILPGLQWWGKISADTGVGWKRNWILQSPFTWPTSFTPVANLFGSISCVLHSTLCNNLFSAVPYILACIYIKKTGVQCLGKKLH